MADRSSFDAAAERLDRFLAEVKDAQYAAAGVTSRPLAPPALADAPDTVWSRQFAARTVRPHAEGAPAMPEPILEPMPLAAAPPSRPPLRVPDGPIGAVLGKPPAGRGPLGRLFGRGKR